MKKRAIPTFWISCLVSSLMALGIGCGEDSSSDDFTDEMEDSGPASGASGAVAEEWVKSDNPMAAVDASLKVVLSDEDVIALLDSQVTAKDYREFDRDCYQKTLAGGLSVEFDFSGCDEYGLAGTVTVSKKLAGPIVVTFNEGFSVKNIAIAGSLSLTRITGKQLTFTAFNSDSEGTAGPPIVFIDAKNDETTTATYDGKIKVDVTGQKVLIWGVSEATTGNVTNTYYLGGESAFDVAGSDPPASALSYPFSPFDCYCPASGVVSGAVNLHITEVTFDLDDFTRENGVDDYPGFSVPVSVNVTGTTIITFTACGEYSVAFEADSDSAISVSVNKEDLLSALEAAKAAGTINTALYNTMKSVISNFQGTSVSIEISAEEMLNALTAQLATDYDVSFCEV